MELMLQRWRFFTGTGTVGIARGWHRQFNRSVHFPGLR